MSKKLDVRQINNLITGKMLGAEISAASADCRAFLYVTAYSIDPAKRGHVSQFLNADHSDARFRIRAFEIDRAHMDRPDADHFERELDYLEGIASFEELETRLSAYLEDLSVLNDVWKLDY